MFQEQRAKMNNVNGNKFEPGAVWNDINHEPIQAHGGGILYDQGTYYWFGENKNGETHLYENETYRVEVIGISCYSSKDLFHWKNEGVVLPANPNDPESDLHPSKVLERPKVIYNAKTKQYVMWVHVDNYNYKLAHAGVAVSDRPTGPYYYVGSSRPNGYESRDMTVFQDEDGKAYLVYSSESHSAMHVSLLTDDYLAQSGKFTRNFVTKPLQGREAPAVFKYDGKFFMITSGCTAWDPNPAEYAMASSMLGPWTVMGNPCAGEGKETTFNAQSTFVLPVQGKPGCFIFMADRWNKHNLGDSRYVWLPFKMLGDGVCIRWMDSWDMSVFG
jgi:beta-galactosidase